MSSHALSHDRAGHVARLVQDRKLALKVRRARRDRLETHITTASESHRTSFKTRSQDRNSSIACRVLSAISPIRLSGMSDHHGKLIMLS